MAWIEMIESDDARPELANIYRRVSGPDGEIDNVLKVHSQRPHTLSGHMALYKAVLHHRGNQLPKWFLEALGVHVSRLNGCGYCDRHHSAGMHRLLNDSERFQALDTTLEQEQPGEPFTAPQQAALGYAEQLTRSPGSICEDDIQSLRNAGFTDGEILEINQVVAYFNYANRTVSGLGVELETKAIGQSPNNSDDPNDWSHS